ncbi:MAG: helix-turn-helix domain-containing protein [Treponema sp.]|jgi:transcriptional regulator with XRE-family HTH domain|nr:helix-turn-helix domain-containing protein [Treponema sp.]
MARLREVFIQNLKEKRKKCRLSQAKLAELVDVSTHHLAMIELSRNFPTIDLVERLATALGAEAYELFVDSASPPLTVEVNRQSFIDDMRQIIDDAVENAFVRRGWKLKD